MQDTSVNLYNSHWDSQAYLREYYSLPHIPDDEVIVVRHLVQWLKQTGKIFTRAIDFGCGPTVHLLAPIAPYVEEIHCADYLAENLAEIQKWRENRPDAHNWDLNIRHVLEVEKQANATDDEVEARKSLMRHKITTLRHCDLRAEQLLGEEITYDLVLSAYCVDASTNQKDEWCQLLGKLLALCAPIGGAIVLLSSCCAHNYHLQGVRLPFANVDEKDIANILANSGFDLDQALIEKVSICDWAELGFDKVVIAIATKR